jgi:hypothetical protein
LTRRARQAATVREGKGKVGRRARAGRRLGLQAERMGEMGLRFFLFFFKLFSKPFQTSNSFETLNTTNPFQNILKTFKTSHQHIKNTMQIKDDAQALVVSKIIQNDI